MNTPGFLVSLHDIWPGNRLVCEALLNDLALRGVSRVALMIVPDFEGKGGFSENADFVSWAKAKQVQGHELFLHGYRHKARPEAKRSLWGRAVNARLTQGESELAGLSPADKYRLALRGYRDCVKAGLALLGFTPPTWFGALPRVALKKLGLRYQDRRWGIEDSAAGNFTWAPPLVWPASSSRHGLAGGEAYYSLARRFPLLRLALHPQDRSQKDFGAVIDKLMKSREVRVYADIGNMPQSAPFEPGIHDAWPTFPL